MKKGYCRSVLLPLIIIPVGGLLILATCYLLYFAIYMFVESVFFFKNPTLVPAGIIRNSYAVILFILYLVLLRARISDLFKATISIGPMTTLIIAVILALYETQAIAVVAIIVIAAFCIFLLYRYKKPWIYYYAAIISVLASIAYAWPRV